MLNEVAKPTAKILVVANPSNTNCATLAAQCPRIPKKNFTSLMILDHNRSVATVAILNLTLAGQARGRGGAGHPASRRLGQPFPHAVPRHYALTDQGEKSERSIFRI